MRLAEVPSIHVPLEANPRGRVPRHRRAPDRVRKRGTRFFVDRGCFQGVSALCVYFCGSSYCYFLFQWCGVQSVVADDGDDQLMRDWLLHFHIWHGTTARFGLLVSTC